MITGLGTILRIARHTFKESVRDRVLYSLVAFAVLLIGVSVLLSQLTAGQEVKIIKDLGLAAISLFGLFIAVFIGTGLVSKEVERRSVYSLLTKPMTRPQFILGKFTGLMVTLTFNVIVMTAALYVVLAVYVWTTPIELQRAWEAPGLDPALMKASLLILAQLAVVTAIALLFSTFAGPIVSAALTLGLTIAGNFSADLKNFDTVIDSAPLVALTRGLYYILPNLASFDVKSQVVHALPVSAGYIAMTGLYAAAYISALLVLATMIFARRDFK